MRSPLTLLSLACEACASRGWLRPRTAAHWPERCPACGGAGRIGSLSELARRLGLPRHVLRSVSAAKACRKGLVVLERLLALARGNASS